MSKEEAQATVDAWYSGRPGVQQWQARTIDWAGKDGFVSTLLGAWSRNRFWVGVPRCVCAASVDPGPIVGPHTGRRRKLPHIGSRDRRLRAAAERAAINTPVQGSAADIVMLAMLALSEDQLLADLGWQLLLQIHDEVILEGPASTSEDALARVQQLMARPTAALAEQLSVELSVDAKIGDSWYAAK